MSSKVRFILVSFSPDGEDPVRLVNAAKRMVTPFGIFEPDMKLEVTLPLMTVGLRESPAKVTIDGTLSLAIDYASGYAVPPCKVTIYEYEESRILDSEVLDTKVRYLYEGEVQVVKRHPNSKEGICLFEISNAKSALSHEAGMSSDEDCNFTFGDSHTCGVDLDPHKEVAIVFEVDKTRIRVPGIPDAWPEIWTRGYIQLRGTTISISHREEGTSWFVVTKLPPLNWVGQVVTFVPGCQKRPQDCIQWQNSTRFNGLGLGTPDHHPVFEHGESEA